MVQNLETQHKKHRYIQKPKESVNMGNTQNAIPPRDDQYFSIIFVMGELYLVHTPPHITQAIQKRCNSAGYISACCSDMMKRCDDGTIRLTLYGFSEESKAQAVRAKALLLRILTDIYAHGYEAVQNTDLSREYAFSTWIFQKMDPQSPRKTSGLLTVGISSYDALHLIGCSQGTNIVVKAVQQGYAGGVQSEGIFSGVCREMKLNGYPWGNGHYADLMAGRNLLLRIFEAMDREGKSILTTCNFKGTSDNLYFTDNPHCDRQGRFAMLSLNSTDCLRVLNLGTEEVGMIRSIIKSYWPRGVQAEGAKAGYYEFKLKGTPWWADGTDAVASRLLMSHLFEAMKAVGWEVHASLDVSRKLRDKSVIVLRSCTPSQDKHICISFNETDKIRILNSTEMVGPLRATMSKWRVDREQDYGGSYEFTMRGNPWGGSADRPFGVVMATDILRTMHRHGWKLLCGADTSAKMMTRNANNYMIANANAHGYRSYSLDVDSWYFAKLDSNVMPPQVYEQPSAPPPPPTGDTFAAPQKCEGDEV